MSGPEMSEDPLDLNYISETKFLPMQMRVWMGFFICILQSFCILSVKYKRMMYNKRKYSEKRREAHYVRKTGSHKEDGKGRV